MLMSLGLNTSPTSVNLRLLLNSIQYVSYHPGISLWGSLPCTPWTTWQFMFIHKYGQKYLDKLEERRNESMLLLSHFRTIAEKNILGGGSVSFEWPRYVTGWLRSEVLTMIHELDMFTVNFHGCAFGMTDSVGVPIKKPWRVVTTSKYLAEALSKYTCSHTDKHSPIEGGNKAHSSAFYPRKLCYVALSNLFPEALRKHVLR